MKRTVYFNYCNKKFFPLNCPGFCCNHNKKCLILHHRSFLAGRLQVLEPTPLYSIRYWDHYALYRRNPNSTENNEKLVSKWQPLNVITGYCDQPLKMAQSDHIKWLFPNYHTAWLVFTYKGKRDVKCFK